MEKNKANPIAAVKDFLKPLGKGLEKIKQNPIVKKLGFNRIILALVLIAMYVFLNVKVESFRLFRDGAFNMAGYNRILNVLNYAYFLGFLALGVTFVIATGGIDFSIGPVMFCSALVSGYCLTSMTYGYPVWLCLLISIGVGLLFGIFNGYLVSYWSVPPFIVSMASMNLAKGLAAVFTKSSSVSWPQGSTDQGWFRNLVKMDLGAKIDNKVLYIPIGLIIFLVVAAICMIVLNKTKAGRYILSLGSNKEAVRLSGVNVKKWEMLAYVICGILVGIAAIFYVAAFTTVQPGYGDQYNNEAIAGCVMGGTSMAGGLASIGGTVIGVLIISLLQEGILALGIAKDYQLIITGMIVIVAVYADVSARRRKN